MGKMMKNVLKKLVRDEEGQAFILVLIFLLVGGLITAPLLSYMSTGLLAGQMHEEKMDELYAADAGVEDALYNIITPGAPHYTNLQDLAGGVSYPPYTLTNINGKTIVVTIYCINKGEASATYKITSVTTSADGSSTTIESYVLTLPLFWKNAATSAGGLGSIDIKPGTVVNGPTDDEYDPAKWPFVESLSSYYYDQIDMGTDEWTSDTVDIEDTPLILPTGSLYRDGYLKIINSGSAGGVFNLPDTSDEFTITGGAVADNGTIIVTQGNISVTTTDGATYDSGTGSWTTPPGGGTIKIAADEANTEGIWTCTAETATAVITTDSDGDATLTDGSILMGTVYVTGNLDIGVTNQDFTLNLNYSTIYVEGDISIGGKTTITGSGVIIAQGKINFQPKMLSNPGDFVFVMSEGGEVNLQPNGDFYGSLAGKLSIDLKPGNTLTLTDPPIDSDGNIMLNFPLGDVESAVKIYTWEINP